MIAPQPMTLQSTLRTETETHSIFSCVPKARRETFRDQLLCFDVLNYSRVQRNEKVFIFTHLTTVDINYNFLTSEILDSLETHIHIVLNSQRKRI